MESRLFFLVLDYLEMKERVDNEYYIWTIRKDNESFNRYKEVLIEWQNFKNTVWIKKDLKGD